MNMIKFLDIRLSIVNLISAYRQERKAFLPIYGNHISENTNRKEVSAMNITKTLKRQDTVYHYSKLLDLFQDNDSDFLQSLTEDELIGIDYALDFE